MVPTQSLLRRQLKRFFGNDFSIPVEWDGFVAAVDSAYAEFVVDREFMERSMELSSQELEQLHKQLADASRQAGMAQIANNVLHNVGVPTQDRASEMRDEPHTTAHVLPNADSNLNCRISV
jgi:hypothetical protein